MSARAILTDIEGTTSSIAFVHDVLFPYSRARLAEYVRAHAGELTDILNAVREAAGAPDMNVEACIAQLNEWHDADRKIGPLKELQGRIWAEGYADGELKGHIYPDAVAALLRWQAQDIPVYVYSSGSVDAQKLIFGHSEAGDLLPLFAGHFDTAVGGKKEAASYRAIASRLGLPAADILFLSDVEEELAAAREAGMDIILLARDGVPERSDYRVATDFDDILPDEVRA